MAFILSRNHALTVPLLSTYGTASLLSRDGQEVKVPLALLLGGSTLVRSMVDESHLHPGIHGPLILSFTVEADVLANVGDMMSVGEANVMEENIAEVTQVLDLLGMKASLSPSRNNMMYEDMATNEEDIKLEIVFEPMCNEETILSDGNVIETKKELLEVEANLCGGEYEHAAINEEDDKLEKVFEPMSNEESDLSEVKVNQAKNNSLKGCDVNVAIEQIGKRPDHSYHTYKKETKENTVKKCNLCEYTAKSAAILKIHMRSHTGGKPFICKICNSSFSQIGNFRRHCRIHSGDKPFKCKICAYSSSGSGSLTRHNRIHSGEKPFKCKICTFCSSDPSTLKKHNRMHTGEKPYTCKICTKSFSRPDTLRNHGRMHAGEKDYCA